MNSHHTNTGRIIVLSDLHLWGPEDPLYRALLNFIDDKLRPDDKFFLVGDVFDLFIGNKSVFRERYYELISRIRGLGSRGVEVYYIEGNHDFQIESVFDDCPHVHLYADTIHYEFDGRKILFCHGDRINWKDWSYQIFRAFTRNLFTQCVIEAVPGPFIDKIGSTMSKASRGSHYEASEQVVTMFRNYACDKISKGYDFVIMGHSHHMDDMRFRVAGHEGQYLNCGYPRKDRRYLELNQGQDFFELKSWEDIVIPLRPAKKANQ